MPITRYTATKSTASPVRLKEDAINARGTGFNTSDAALWSELAIVGSSRELDRCTVTSAEHSQLFLYRS